MSNRVSVDMESKMVGVYESFKESTFITEFRRISMQTALNNLFKDPRVCADSAFLCNFLGITDKFYDFAITDLLTDSVHTAIYNTHLQIIEEVEGSLKSGRTILAEHLIHYLFEKQGRVQHRPFESDFPQHTIKVHVFFTMLEQEPPLVVEVRREAPVRVLL
jgi:hypothetical protein